MADLLPPEDLRKPTGELVHISDPKGLKKLSIAGKEYDILDSGFVCGAPGICGVYILSEETCLFSTPPYCSVCDVCWHMEGIVRVPDYLACGQILGHYGMLVKFKPPWKCKCLKDLGFVSYKTNKLQDLGISNMCGSPSMDVPLFGFKPFG
jgi:hypothetical protein